MGKKSQRQEVQSSALLDDNVEEVIGMGAVFTVPTTSELVCKETKNICFFWILPEPKDGSVERRQEALHDCLWELLNLLAGVEFGQNLLKHIIQRVFLSCTTRI